MNNTGPWAEASTLVVQVTKYYTFGGRRACPECNRRVAMRQGGVVYYLHADHLGSTNLVTDHAARITARQRYFPYGEVRWREGTLPTDFAFTGQRVEAGLGLLDYRARFYAPVLGRFVSADTLVPNPGNPQDLNRYAYVRNNPLRYTDPTGHYILLEDDFGVRVTQKGMVQVVHGGSHFANPVEVALANAILSGEPRHLEAIPSDVQSWALQHSLDHVASELGYGGSASAGGDLLLDPMVTFGLAFGMVKAAERGEIFPAETIPPGERLEYTETPWDAAAREAGTTYQRWRPGDPINAPTRNGYPSWSTVRRRYWINKALNASPGDFDEVNLARMRQGLARQDPDTGASRHLHHISGRGVPDPHNPANLKEMWPWEHYAIHRR